MAPTEERSTYAGNKEPWLAVNLSRILPGIGQIYAGQSIKGWLILLSYFILVGTGGWLILNGGFLLGISLLTIALLVLPIWNLFDAHRTAARMNSQEFETTRKQSKDPWLAVFLSVFIPGLGHAYLQKWLSAIAFFVVFLILVGFGGSQNVLIQVLANLLQFVLAIVVFYHVYTATPMRRERSSQALALFIAAFVGISIVLSTILAIVIRQFVAEARYIPAGSMLPTLQISDRLIIDKLTYRFESPKRGDIVVFSPTEALKKQNFNDAFIKRIIGLPGDRVQVKGGLVYINDQPLREPYIGKENAADYEWGPQVVPPNAYFVLGDNRNNSYDSHYWGFVPRENIIGKATQRFYPFDRVGPLAAK
ncbi:signal peptidase I [Leptolyngbya sp. NIES-3755]|nr:signal peptidase I [Leptolyngbya sp. NIES-3755]